MLQRTEVSGWPALLMVARKGCLAPSSTLAFGGASAIAMSLVIVSSAVADFVVSASLVAVTCTIADAGRSAGAVYVPPDVIVPVAEAPPGTPFTLHVTLLFVVFVTVAVSVCELPSSTAALVGVTDTLTSGGGGVGGGVLRPVLPPPQPRGKKQSGSWRSRTARRVLRERVEMRPLVFVLICERGGRMPHGIAGEGPAKEIAGSGRVGMQ